MSNELQTTKQTSLVTNDFSKDKIALIKATVAKDSTDLELQFFIEQCKRTGLDPVTRQIYFIKDKNGKVNIQTSIDGLRLIAERSGDYAGQTSPEWCSEDGVWKDVWLSPKTPSACRVGVLRHSFKQPLYAIAVFNEYAQKTKDYKTGEEKLNYIWGSKPAHMLCKVAEALALRKAFPNDMSGIYTTDEYTPEVAQETKTITNVEVIGEKTNEASRTNVQSGVRSDFKNSEVYSGVQEPETSAYSSFNQNVSGYGTQGEFSETGSNASYVIRVGKNKDKTLEEAGPQAVNNLYGYFKDLEKEGKAVEGYAREFMNKAPSFLRSHGINV